MNAAAKAVRTKPALANPSGMLADLALQAIMIPQKPTPAMLAAGAAAGGVPIAKVWAIFQAMITEAG